MATRQAFVEDEEDEEVELDQHDVSANHSYHSALRQQLSHRTNGSSLKAITSTKIQFTNSSVEPRRTAARTTKGRTTAAERAAQMASPTHSFVGTNDGSTEEYAADEEVATTVSAGAQEALRAQFERKRAEAAVIVPTDDKHVRARLRSLGHPITLFGEDKPTRRDRLRSILFELQQSGEDQDVVMQDVEGKHEPPEQETVYHGGVLLLQARKDIVRYSVARGKQRLEFQKAEAKIIPRRHLTFRKTIKENLNQIDLWGSQQAADRPLASVRFAPDGQTVAVGSWGGDLKIFEVPSMNEKHIFRGHDGVVGGLSWNTDSSAFDSENGLHLASGDGDGRVLLWSVNSEKPLGNLKSQENKAKAHDSRVACVEFHPSAKYLATASHDTTWRLWDLTTGAEILIQEGHSDACHTLSWSIDGSLLASGGYDAIGRIFDIRSGKIIMYLDSHIDHIYTLDWGTDGHRIMSGAADGFLKVWDLRQVKEVASIGAHSNGVANVRWFKGTDGPGSVDLPAKDNRGFLPKKSGTVFVTGGMDSNVNVWSADDWAKVKALKAHEGTVTGVDMSADGRFIVSASRDKTIKVWGREDAEPF